MSRKILVIRRDNVGDMVLTTPLLAALRARLPDATIDVLSNSYAAPVLAGNTDVDAVHVYTKSHHRQEGQSRLGVYLGRARTVLELRAQRYDSIVLAKLPAEPRPLAFARIIGATEIVGLVKPGDAPRRGLTHAIRWDPSRRAHMVEALMQLGEHFGIHASGGPVTVHPQPRARAAALAGLAPVVSPGTPLVALNLSARKVKQRWPVERFIALGRALHERYGCTFMLVWSPGASDNPRHPGDDAKAAEVLAGLAGVPVVALRTVQLAELIAALSLAQAMITADGGAMHLGAACGLPVVALFGNSEPALWHPWRVPHEILQHPARDVGLIGVAEVLAAWDRLAVHAGLRAAARAQPRVWGEQREKAPASPLVASR
jgi:ADP-heptose:LPS heptosyltransferase